MREKGYAVYGHGLLVNHTHEVANCAQSSWSAAAKTPSNMRSENSIQVAIKEKIESRKT